MFKELNIVHFTAADEFFILIGRMMSTVIMLKSPPLFKYVN